MLSHFTALFWLKIIVQEDVAAAETKGGTEREYNLNECLSIKQAWFRSDRTQHIQIMSVLLTSPAPVSSSATQGQ